MQRYYTKHKSHLLISRLHPRLLRKQQSCRREIKYQVQGQIINPEQNEKKAQLCNNSEFFILHSSGQKCVQNCSQCLLDNHQQVEHLEDPALSNIFLQQSPKQDSFIIE